MGMRDMEWVWRLYKSKKMMQALLHQKRWNLTSLAFLKRLKTSLRWYISELNFHNILSVCIEHMTMCEESFSGLLYKLPVGNQLKSP